VSCEARRRPPSSLRGSIFFVERERSSEAGLPGDVRDDRELDRQKYEEGESLLGVIQPAKRAFTGLSQLLTYPVRLGSWNPPGFREQAREYPARPAC
jgi:hypothetical protein